MMPLVLATSVAFVLLALLIPVVTLVGAFLGFLAAARVV